MTNILRSIYRFWAVLLFVAVVAQIGAAGYGAFSADHKADKLHSVTHKQFDHGFGAHIALGYLLFLGSLLLFLFAIGARLGRRRVLLAFGAPLLVFVAIALAVAGGNVPAVGVLHPIVGFLIVGLFGYLAHQAWTGRTTTGPATPTP
jgi:hypothetical protein